MDIDNYISETTGNVYCKDKTGKYLCCNLTFAKIAGFSSPEKIIGKTDHDLFLPFLEERGIKEIVNLDQAIMFYDIEKTVIEIGINQSKLKAKYISKKAPLKNKYDKIIGIVGTSLEITDQISTNILTISSTENLKIPKLSQRQIECLYYLFRGLTNKQIAKTLNLSPRTIETYVEQLKNKLACNTKSELIAKAFELNLFVL